MIKQLSSEDIPIILVYKPDVSDIVNCTIGEWVQLLMRIVENENFLLLGAYKEGALTGYIVLRNNISPPVANNIRVIFAHLENVENEDMHEIINAMINWARSLGADFITALCKKKNRYLDFGFIETGMVSVERKI